MRLLITLISVVFITSTFAQEWTVKQGELIKNNNSADSIALKYWKEINSILPQDPIRKYVTVFSLRSDGLDGDLAGMTSLNHQNTNWEIDIDTIDFNFNRTDTLKLFDFYHTLIHEFGHLISLNHSQINSTYDEYQDDRKGYLTYEGYAPKGSYLFEFVYSFWPIELLNDWDEIDKVKNQNKRDKKITEFYYRHNKLFLSKYAADSPEEDWSESWTFFILLTDAQAKNHPKTKFFYRFPELVQYKNAIKANLAHIPHDYYSLFKNHYED